MEQKTSLPVTLGAAVTSYLCVMLQHAWMIFTFRHTGEGLHDISNRHLALLVMPALMCVWYLPYLAHGGQLPSIGLIAIGLASFAIARFQFGVAVATGFALMMLLTIPTGHLIRLTTGSMGTLLDAGLSLWSLLANITFAIRCSRQAKPKK